MPGNSFGSVVTLAEAAKTVGPSGEMLAVVDVISQGTPVMEEGHWEESNDFESYRLLQTMTEAIGTDAIINQGVNWEVNTLRPVTEIIQDLESALKIDIRILRKQKNAEEFKRIQAELFLRGLGKSFHDRFFYGNTNIAPTTAVSPDEITGLHSPVQQHCGNPVQPDSGRAVLARERVLEPVATPEAVSHRFGSSSGARTGCFSRSPVTDRTSSTWRTCLRSSWCTTPTTGPSVRR